MSASLADLMAGVSGAAFGVALPAALVGAVERALSFRLPPVERGAR